MKETDLQEAKSLLAQIKQNMYPQTSTGYASLDRLTGGLIRGGVTLIGGRVAMGRSSLSLNMVSRVAMQQTGNILVFSPRYSTREMTIRLLTIGMDLPAEKLLDGSLSVEERQARCADFLRVQKSNIKIIPTTYLSQENIQYYCDWVANLRLVVVDGLEHIYEPFNFSPQPGNLNMPRKAMDKILLSLKKLALTKDIPVIGTVTVHRSIERRKNKRPKLSDLKKIDVPAELADQIMFLYRDRYYDSFGYEKAEVIVAKNRPGKTGTVELDWDYETGRLVEITDG